VKTTIKLIKKAYRISVKSVDTNDVEWVEPDQSSSDASRQYAIKTDIPIIQISAARDKRQDGIEIDGSVYYRHQDIYEDLKGRWLSSIKATIKNNNGKSAIIYSDKSNHRNYWRDGGGFTANIKSAKIYKISEVWNTIKNKELETMIGIMVIDTNIKDLKILLGMFDIDGIMNDGFELDNKARDILNNIKRDIKLLLEHLSSISDS
jgi:hypothetical protein